MWFSSMVKASPSAAILVENYNSDSVEMRRVIDMAGRSTYRLVKLMSQQIVG